MVDSNRWEKGDGPDSEFFPCMSTMVADEVTIPLVTPILPKDCIIEGYRYLTDGDYLGSPVEVFKRGSRLKARYK